MADAAVNALTADDTGDDDGPNTAELDALDVSLVESIGDYTTENGRTSLDVADLPAAADDTSTEPDTPAAVDEPTPSVVEPVADSVDDADSTDADSTDLPEAAAAELFVEDEYEDDFVDDDQTFDVPSIVAITELAEAIEDGSVDADPEVSDEGTEAAEAKDGSKAVPGVSPNILEELRKADIDGPVVDAAPQDDTTSSRRRPKQAVDYDPAPVPVPLKVPRILGRKPRVRKVTRVVRHVDPWSIFKIALIANLVLYVIVLTAGVLLWNVAYATGTVENVERFFESFGWQSFEFNGGELYHAAWIAGLFAVIGLTGLWVLLATLFNLITDIVGGARFTVLEEEVVESRTSPMRRFVVRRPEPEIPATFSDSSGPLIREVVVDESGSIER